MSFFTAQSTPAPETSPRTTAEAPPAPQAERRLRTTFRWNAATSIVTGLLAAAIPGTLDRALGTGHAGWVRLVGIGLVVFAVGVALLAGARTPRLVRGAPAVIAADVAWVVATIATIAAGWFDPAGAVLVAGTGVVVGTFAALQRRHLTALRRATAPDASHPS